MSETLRAPASEESESGDDTVSVFLSHNSVDKDAIGKINENLKQHQFIKVWLDSEQIRAGDPIPEYVQLGIESCDVIVVFFGENDVGKSQITEVHDASKRFSNNDVTVIPVLLPHVQELPPDLTYNWLRDSKRVEFASSIDEEAPLAELVDAIKKCDRRKTDRGWRPVSRLIAFVLAIPLIAVLGSVLAGAWNPDVTGGRALLQEEDDALLQQEIDQLDCAFRTLYNGEAEERAWKRHLNEWEKLRDRHSILANVLLDATAFPDDDNQKIPNWYIEFIAQHRLAVSDPIKGTNRYIKMHNAMKKAGRLSPCQAADQSTAD